MHGTHQRILFLDFLRGAAVMVMVMGHSIDAVLGPAARTTDLFHAYDAVRGFTAPLFLFVSGYAFTLTSQRHWHDVRRLGRPLVRRLAKVLTLLVVGYALHVPFLSLQKVMSNTSPLEYAQFFRVDILHCVAVAMILGQLLLMAAPTPRAFAWSTLGLAGIIVIATPWISTLDALSLGGPAVAPYCNQRVPSIFPLFPYAAFFLAGTAIGHFHLAAHVEAREPAFVHRLFVIGVVAMVYVATIDHLPIAVLPPHDYWTASPSFFLIRLATVVIITGGFTYIRRLPGALQHVVVSLGQASFLVYAAHLLVVYGSAANDGLQQTIGQTLAYAQAAGVGLAVLLGMVILVALWNHARAHHVLPFRFLQIGAGSAILYLFLTRPY